MTQHAIVTGASSGIGEAFARTLAGHGYRITAVARGEDKLRALIADLHDRLRPSLITGRNNRLLTWIATKFLSRKQRLALLGRRSPGMRG